MSLSRRVRLLQPWPAHHRLGASESTAVRDRPSSRVGADETFTWAPMLMTLHPMAFAELIARFWFSIMWCTDLTLPTLRLIAFSKMIPGFKTASHIHESDDRIGQEIGSKR
jgi:hypothetical protein